MKSLAEPLALTGLNYRKQYERDRRMPAEGRYPPNRTLFRNGPDSAELIDLVMRGKPTLNLPSSPVARREREPLPLAPRAYGMRASDIFGMSCRSAVAVSQRHGLRATGSFCFGRAYRP